MSAHQPERVEGLEVHEVDDGFLVYQAGNDRVHSLNATASVVFELCTGEHTEAEIASLVGDTWGLATPPIDAVHACLQQLRSEGVIA